MTAELGTFFLIIALLVSLFQAAYLCPGVRIKIFITGSMQPAPWLSALCLTLALGTLMALRLDSDFSVVNVVVHSNRALPLLYKIAGTWGNHEGSMLLFAWVIVIFGAILATSRSLDSQLRQQAVAVQALVAAGVMLFILFTSNPFERRFPPSVEGQALNPLLQDVALAIHPPLLYVGYVGFSIVFSLSVAALLAGRVDRNWAHVTHPWIMASWSALTLGIGLGSWWAYRELGWGGWWFWDPVENASLLPWLAGTALFHSNIVLKKRGLLAPWVLVLSIITFGLSLIGTFLVRSGALISVHSFASDPMRGMFILAYMAITIGTALLLFAIRAAKLAPAGEMLPVSREGMIVINNLFLLTACATVLLGTTYPLLAEWLTNDKLTVGPPYFNITFLPLMAIPLLGAGLVPLMAWEKASFMRALKQARPAMLATLAVVVLILAMHGSKLLFAAMGFGLSAWLAASSVQWLLAGRRQGKMPVFIGHLGVAVMVAGITSVSLFKQETERWVEPGNVIELGNYKLTYGNEIALNTDNYTGRRGEFAVEKSGRQVALLAPEYRTYSLRKTATSEASIYSSFGSDLYAVLGEPSADGKRTAARIYYVPMIHFIWAGFMLMALSGLIAILQRTKNLGKSSL